ncbi:MAG: hypothetical protein IPN79_08375 [Saprospiraceae bacterium]|nr:hypothetical protein [Saprospiraceae bacterium]
MNSKDLDDLIKGQFVKNSRFQELVKTDATKPVKAISSKVSDHNITIRIRDVKGLPDFAKPLGCRPRTQTDGRPTFTLPDVLIKNFDVINQNLSKWLAENKDNSKLFLENPMKAIQSAGVKLDRSALKELHNIHADGMSKLMVSPEVKSLKISAQYKKGAITNVADRKTESK